MGVIGVYRVTGARAYRGHAPGTEFWGRLDVLAERRAVARGDIVVLDRIVPQLEPGSFALPRDWSTEQGGR